MPEAAKVALRPDEEGGRKERGYARFFSSHPLACFPLECEWLVHPSVFVVLLLARAEGMFRKWLDATDEILARHTAPPLDEDGQPVGPAGSPTFFERNLNVWRQLWRTTETSDILLVLVGAFALRARAPSSGQSSY